MCAPRGNSGGPNTKGNREAANATGIKYVPTPKHDKSGWGTLNPIKSKKEGQALLNTGVKDGKQVYNVTKDGKIVKFQPDNTPKTDITHIKLIILKILNRQLQKNCTMQA